MSTPAPLPTASSSVWSRDALFGKAQRYAEQMLAQPRDEWCFGLWASLALEHLARACVAHISPTLLADPRDWQNTYSALGHVPKAKRFLPKSIDTGSVLARLREFVPGFDERLEGIASIHASRRNEELHSGGVPYDGLKTSAWLPAYYEVCEVLLTFLGADLAALVGSDEAAVARNLIDASRNQSAKAVLASVAAHRTVWDSKDPAQQQVLGTQAAAWAMRQVGHRTVCPSCGCDALLAGSPVAPPAVTVTADQIVETQYFLPSRFECIACGLKISGVAELHAVDLGDTYKSTTVSTALEYYGEQLGVYADYEPDYNEP